MPEEKNVRIEGAESALLRLTRSSIGYGVANFGARALAFLLLPVFTRFLTPAEFGIVSVAEAIAVMIGTVAVLGLPSAAARLYFFYPERSEQARALLGSVTRVAWLSAAAVALISLLLG